MNWSIDLMRMTEYILMNEHAYRDAQKVSQSKWAWVRISKYANAFWVVLWLLSMQLASCFIRRRPHLLHLILLKHIKLKMYEKHYYVQYLYSFIRYMNRFNSPVKFPWCSWLSHPPNTRKVSGSNPDGNRISFSIWFLKDIFNLSAEWCQNDNGIDFFSLQKKKKPPPDFAPNLVTQRVKRSKTLVHLEYMYYTQQEVFESRRCLCCVARVCKRHLFENGFTEWKALTVTTHDASLRCTVPQPLTIWKGHRWIDFRYSDDIRQFPNRSSRVCSYETEI